MKERVLVTALSICVLLAMCPNAMVYAAGADFHIADLIQELDTLQEEVSEKVASVSAASEDDDTQEDNSEENTSFDLYIPSLPVFSIYAVCEASVLTDSQSLVSEGGRSVSSLRAPPFSSAAI